MDPKGVAKPAGAWEDNKPSQGQFRRLVILNDGTKAWEIYEYGTDGPVALVYEGQNLGTDPKQASDYADYVKKVTPVRTDVDIVDGREVHTETPEGGQPRVIGSKPAPAAAASKPATTSEPVTGPGGNTSMVTWELLPDGTKGRVLGQEPMTEAQVAALKGTPTAAQQTAKEESARKEEETKKNTWTTTGTSTVKDEAAGTSKTVQIQTNQLGETRPIETVVQELKPGEKYGNPQQGASGQVQPVLNAEGKVIRWEPMPEGGPVKETPLKAVDLPNGGKGNLIADPSQPSGYRVEPISGTEKKPDTAVPSVDLTQATMGKYTDALKKQWDEKYVPLINAGTITMADALKYAEKDRLEAQAKANEEIGVLNAQQNIRGQDVTQRGQTLNSVENQRSNYTATARDILGAVLKNPAPGGLQAAESMIRGIGTIGSQMGIPMGVPSEQPYAPQQAQVMGAPGPSPIVFNINTGGAQPQSAPLAGMGAQMGLPGGVPETPGVMQPPTNPEQLLDEMKRNTPDQFWTAAVDRVGQDLQRARERAAGGVAPGMSLSGGQLRAPGVSAGAVSAGPVGQVG